MADTGFKTTGVVVSTGGWSNLTTARINTSDNSYATGAGSSYDVGVLSTFDFGIPAGVTIDGIEIQAEFRTETTGWSANLRFSLSGNGGISWTDTKLQTNNKASDVTKTYGGPDDTWGKAWEADELSDNNFRVKIEGYVPSSSNQDCMVDLVVIKVYYTEAGGLTKCQAFIV